MSDVLQGNCQLQRYVDMDMSADEDEEEALEASRIVSNGESESATYVLSKHFMNYDC